MKAIWYKWKMVLRVSAVVFVPLWTFFALGFHWNPGTSTEFWIAAGMSVAYGLLIGLLDVRKLKIWMVTVSIGVILGVLESTSFLFGITTEGQFIVAVVTYVFFASFGVLVGAFAEIIGYLHHLAHGNSVWHYPKHAPKKPLKNDENVIG